MSKFSQIFRWRLQTKFELPLSQNCGEWLCKLGGTKRKTQIQEGKDSIWSLTIDGVEVTCHILKGKKQVEEQLSQDVAKCHRMEADIKALKSEAATLHNVKEKQADTIVCLRTGRTEGGRGDSSKTWSQYSQHQNETKKVLGANVQAALLFH